MVSNTNNPLGGWRVYPLHTEPTGYAGDHPDLAITNDKIVITQNSVNGPGGGSYDKGEIILCDKAEILDNISDCYNTTGIQSQYLSVYPVQSLNNVSYTYLIAVQTYITGTQITYFNLSGPADDANVISLATVYPTIIPPIVAPQGNTSYGINFTNVGIKVLSAASYDGKMWFAFNGACYINYDAHDCTTAVTSSETDGIYMIETDTNPTLDSQAAIFAATYVSPKFYFFFPALTIDKYGDLEMIFGFSSRNDYPSLGALVLINGNFSLDYITTIKHGNSNISTSGAGFGNNTRYGDNFGASLDPANRGLAWVTGEYGQLGTNQSGTNLTINYDWATCISNIEINILKANVSMVIYNKQPVPTPSPFQQLINASNYIYSGKANSNFSNVEFFYQNGTIIPSWLESYNYSKAALWWLKLSGGIPANSSLTIYMGFTANDTNLLNQQITGEAPQLSSQYGKYDDGADVFVRYWDFSGTSLPSAFTAWNGPNTCNGVFHPYGDCAAPAVDDGLILGGGKNTMAETVENNGTYYFYPAIDTLDIGFVSNQTDQTPALAYGIASSNTTEINSQGDDFVGFNGNGGNIDTGESIQAGSSSAVVTGSSGSAAVTQFDPTPPKVHDLVESIATINSTSVRAYADYKPIANASIYPDQSSGELLIASNNASESGTAASMTVYWARTRSTPPDGAMPLVSFGNPSQTVFKESGIIGTPAWNVTYNGTIRSAAAPSPIIFTWTPPFGGTSFTVPSITNSTPGISCYTTQTPSPSSGSAQPLSTTTITFTHSTFCTTEIVFEGVSSGYILTATYGDQTASLPSPGVLIFRTHGAVSKLAYTVSISPPRDQNSTCTASYFLASSSGYALTGSMVYMNATASGYTIPQTDTPCKA